MRLRRQTVCRPRLARRDEDECCELRRLKWRRGWDSNRRYGYYRITVSNSLDSLPVHPGSYLEGLIIFGIWRCLVTITFLSIPACFDGFGKRG